MRHLDDATIIALRDEDVAEGSTYAHLDECATCVAAAEVPGSSESGSAAHR